MKKSAVKKNPEKWMREVGSKNKGLLRKKLGAKAGEPIPKKKLNKAAKSSDLTLKREAVAAKNMIAASKKRKK